MPGVVSMIEVLADPLQDQIDVCDFILAGDTLDNSAGEQLDFYGELIGVQRPMLQEDPENIFTLRRLGYTGDPDNSTGFYNETGGDGTGGYLTSLEGINSKTSPGSTIADADYRRLIRGKAKTLRKKMTVENLFTFLLRFGARCKIDDDTAHTVIIDPADLDDLNGWERWYASTKGFKPGGISVDFQTRLRHKEPI
jgi:hypothetical protein